MKSLYLLRENLRISFQSIRSNILRTTLTILIIAIGILALVGTLTAIDAIKASISSEFTRMGANTFTIQSRGIRVRIGGKRIRTKNHSHITYQQAKRFKEEFEFPARVSISVFASYNSTVKYESIKTNPNIRIEGVDENYIHTAGYDIARGRNMTVTEVHGSSNVVLIGSKLAKTLFGDKKNHINEVVAIGNGKYKVVGILVEKGSSMGGRADDICLLPLTNVRQYFARPQMSYKLNVQPNDPKMLSICISEAEGIFRVIRKLHISDETDFNLNKSDNLASMMIENIQYVTVAATVVAIITLFGAAIGLMNIMLVSVSERTREIGTRKAIGATSKIIKQQFLFESIIIGQLGGIIGIIFGIIVGNLVSVSIGSQFIIPWVWILGGVVLCLIVSLLSGLLPAIKASKLDPIIALRYE